MVCATDTGSKNRKNSRRRRKRCRKRPGKIRSTRNSEAPHRAMAETRTLIATESTEYFQNQSRNKREMSLTVAGNTLFTKKKRRTKPTALTAERRTSEIERRGMANTRRLKRGRGAARLRKPTVNSRRKPNARLKMKAPMEKTMASDEPSTSTCRGN